MEQWYKDLTADPAGAYDCFANDYSPYTSILATLSGNILDVGGGVGIVRDYLPRGIRYTVIDPSLDWLSSEWTSLAGRFPSLRTKPSFVRGIGEYLPFPAQAFDAVLAFWTLNHTTSPEQVFSEVHRVLRLGGRFIVVLEDMTPSWGDIANGAFPASMVASGGGDPSKKHPAHFSGHEWPLQSDHIRICESDLQAWTWQKFEVVRREWINQYLTFEFEKIESLQRDRTRIKDTEAQQSQYRIRILQNERRDFVRQLQAREQRLRELGGALVKKRQEVQRLKKQNQRLERRIQNLNQRLERRIQNLNQQAQIMRNSPVWKLSKRLDRIRAKLLRR